MLKLLLLLLCVGCSACKQGAFSVQNFYYPEGSLPEDAWKARARVYVESIPGKRLSDVTEKPFKIIVINRQGKILYEESGMLNSGAIRATAEWSEMKTLLISVTDRDGKDLIERILELDRRTGKFLAKEI